MRILFVDDMKNRFDTFQQRTIGHIVDWAKSANEAYKFLDENIYDAIFLDNDLSEEDIMSDSPIYPTGQDVARYIIKDTNRYINTKFFIHSMNNVGATAIKNILGDVGLHAIIAAGCWTTVRFN